MTITAHVFQVFIAAEPDVVWAALTESDWTRRWFFSTAFAAPPEPGQGYRSVFPDGRHAVDGVIEECVPPADGRPGRLVQTWHVLYDAAMAQEPPSRVEWTVQRAGEGLTRVRLTHTDLAASPLTWAHVREGWPWALDSLKSALETGRGLPMPDPEPTRAGDQSRMDEGADAAGGIGGATESSPEPQRATADGDWHRAQAVAANNRAFQLLEGPRAPETDEDLLRTAYAAAYHWTRATGASVVNEVRASYLIAKALVVTGQPQAGLGGADRCLALCVEHGLSDFDLAYAQEVRARALLALGRHPEAIEAATAAFAVPIEDPEDRAIVEADLADLPR